MESGDRKGKRPVLEVKRSRSDWVFEALAAAAVIYGLILVIAHKAR